MKILVALDGSDASLNALKSACRLARGLRSHVAAFYVNKGPEYSPEETAWTSIKDRIARELETFGREVIHKAYEIGKTYDVPVEGVVADGIPAQEILRYISVHGIVKLVAMGHSSKGRGTQEFVASTTRSLVIDANVPVFVVSREVEVRNILVAVDDSAESRRATAFAGTLAKSLGAVLGVWSFIPDAEATINEYTRIAEVPHIDRYIEASERGLAEMVERTLSATKDILDSIGVNAPALVKKGRPADEILAEADNHDLLIVGLRRAPSHKKLGGIANRLIEAREISTIFVQ
jgi:nucleotide-binding universal stress UspA family protein